MSCPRCGGRIIPGIGCKTECNRRREDILQSIFNNEIEALVAGQEIKISRLTWMKLLGKISEKTFDVGKI